MHWQAGREDLLNEVLLQLRSAAPTGLPAILMLPLLPVFLLLPARYTREFYIISGVLLLTVFEGPVLAGGVVCVVVAGYFLVEWLALRAKPVSFWVAWALLHLGFFLCYQLPMPAWYDGVPEHNRGAVFILFSGIGLCFFRLVGYLNDRCRYGEDRVSLLNFLAFMFFFPQLRHGPVERCHAFSAQLSQARTNWHLHDLGMGFGRLLAVLVGLRLLMDVVVQVQGWGGDWLAAALPPIDDFERLQALLAHPETLSAGQFFVFISMPLFALWLFEATTTHIQLAVSRVFGVKGTENYRNCILAESPRVVWRRWNITLSQWLHRNVYMLFQGRRRPMLGTLLTFLYCGAIHSPLQLRSYVLGLWCAVSVIVAKTCYDRFRFAKEVRGWGHLRVFVQRVLMVHWAMLTILILIDYQNCGWFVFIHYLKLIGGALSRLVGV